MVAAGGAAWETAAISEIEAAPSLRLVRRCVDVADLLAVAHAEIAGAALVSVDLGGLDVDTVSRLERAGVRVAAVESDAGRCEALGITRRLRLGELDAVARDAAPAQPDHAVDRAPVIAVWGPAGAPGRSTVSLAIASATAARGVDTVLVDADTYGGSLGQALGMLDDVSGLVAACRAANQGRGHEVVEHLLDVDPQLRLLSGLPRADMWPQVRTGAFDVVLSRLRDQAELVVIDCGFSLESAGAPGSASRNQTTLQVLDEADTVVVVGRPDPVGLARLVRGLHDLADIAPGCELVVVINMMRSTLGWDERDVRSMVARLTGRDPYVFLPFDPSGLDLAAVSGRSPRQAAPSSPFVARAEVLAASLLPTARTQGVLSPSV